MNRDDDIHVPNMGPAEPGGKSSSAAMHAVPSMVAESAPQRGGGSLIQTLVLLILVAAVSALGYFGFDMYQLQQKRTAELELSRAQLTELREMLKVAEEGAEASGQSMLVRVAALEKGSKAKNKQLDSEIDKLWALSHRKNKPQIEKQAKTIASQAKTIKSLKSSVAKQDKQIKSLLALKAEADKLKKNLSAQTAEVQKLVQRLETEVRSGTELIEVEQEEQRKTLRSLTDRTAALEGRSNKELERRVGLNEQAVRAFDGTRRQLNQDLFQVKQKLNSMQLQLEKR